MDRKDDALEIEIINGEGNTINRDDRRGSISSGLITSGDEQRSDAPDGKFISFLASRLIARPDRVRHHGPGRARDRQPRHYELGPSHRGVATPWGGTIESQGRNTFHEEINARGALWLRDHQRRYRTMRGASGPPPLCAAPYWQSVKPTVLHRGQLAIQLASRYDGYQPV